MKLHISHGADPVKGLGGSGERDWFIVKPLEGQETPSVAGTPITHDMAVWSLLSAGRAVYEADLDNLTITRLAGKNPARGLRKETRS